MSKTSLLSKKYIWGGDISIGKIMERCVCKHIHNYLLENNIITNSQSGFTKGDSAIHQLINITNEFGKALDEDKEVITMSFIKTIKK
jgi:hypothetical protein